MSAWDDLRTRLSRLDRRAITGLCISVGLLALGLVYGWVGSTPESTRVELAKRAPAPHALGDPSPTEWETATAPPGYRALDRSDSPGRAQLDSRDPSFAALPPKAAPGPDSEPDTLDCIIEPGETVKIRSPVEGRIDAIHVDRSDTVEVGTVLVELESGAERAAVLLADARAKQTGSVNSRQTSLELSRRRRDRAQELYGKQVLSLENREELETEARIAELDLQQAREARQLAEFEYRHAQQLLDLRTIRSPVRGVVVDRSMSVGEVVDDETILTLAQLDPLRVEVVLPAARFGSVKPGMRAAVVPELGRDEVLVASVKIVDRVIDAASGTFRAQLDLPNPDQAIPGGLHCQVRFLPD